MTDKKRIEAVCKCGEFGKVHIRVYAGLKTRCEEASAASHTPGPWIVSEVIKDKSEFQALVGNQIEGWSVAGVYKHPKLQFNGKEHVHVNTKERKERALADARLIAAAPELLKMLTEEHEDVIDVGGEHDQNDCRVCELIAKAEGRS